MSGPLPDLTAAFRGYAGFLQQLGEQLDRARELGLFQQYAEMMHHFTGDAVPRHTFTPDPARTRDWLSRHAPANLYQDDGPDHSPVSAYISQILAAEHRHWLGHCARRARDTGHENMARYYEHLLHPDIYPDPGDRDRPGAGGIHRYGFADHWTGGVGG